MSSDSEKSMSNDSSKKVKIQDKSAMGVLDEPLADVDDESADDGGRRWTHSCRFGSEIWENCKCQIVISKHISKYYPCTIYSKIVRETKVLSQ